MISEGWEVIKVQRQSQTSILFNGHQYVMRICLVCMRTPVYKTNLS